MLTVKQIMKNNFQAHPFHLVDQSPWPILISFSLFFMVIGGVLYLQGYNGYLFMLGLILTTSIMILWFSDVNSEATYNGHHTKQVKRGLVYGFYLFVISEVFAFISVFWAYFHSSIVPSVEIGISWPPLGITPLNPYAIPLLNTFLLLSSGAFITLGHHALLNGNRFWTYIGFIGTIVLAVVFTVFQYIEYSDSSFSITDSVFGTTFFAATGLHGFHVIVGTIFITVSFYRIIKYLVSKQTHIGIESSIIYWHFVDIVWLFLFIAVYCWGSSGAL
jgi:cytochrome c oxidase subunit 3